MSRARKREEEKTTEESIVNEAREEAALRAEYAVAFVSPATTLAGVFESPYGDLTFVQDGNVLRGTVEFVGPAGLSLGGLLIDTSETPQTKSD